VRGPFTAEELRSHRDKHWLDWAPLDEYAAGKPLYAWEFTDVRRYEYPVGYEHRQGAAIWVRLPLSRPVQCSSCGQEYPAADPSHRGCGSLLKPVMTD
jgi:hypothetical protein